MGRGGARSDAPGRHLLKGAVVIQISDPGHPILAPYSNPIFEKFNIINPLTPCTNLCTHLLHTRLPPRRAIRPWFERGG